MLMQSPAARFGFGLYLPKKTLTNCRPGVHREQMALLDGHLDFDLISGAISQCPFFGQHHAQAGFDRCKSLVKAAGLSGPGKVRVNKAGCLDRCAGGPVAVVYPEAVWYHYVDQSDIDEIVDSHLIGGKPVDRLLLAPDIGR